MCHKIIVQVCTVPINLFILKNKKYKNIGIIRIKQTSTQQHSHGQPMICAHSKPGKNWVAQK